MVSTLFQFIKNSTLRDHFIPLPLSIKGAMPKGLCPVSHGTLNISIPSPSFLKGEMSIRQSGFYHNHQMSLRGDV